MIYKHVNLFVCLGCTLVLCSTDETRGLYGETVGEKEVVAH